MLSLGLNRSGEKQSVITLKDSIEIKAAPERVFEWLVQHMKDKESYQAWHPERL
jgi:hypothetical protein